jgi:hypothetical protein
VEQAAENGVQVLLDIDFRADQWKDIRSFGLMVRAILPKVDKSKKVIIEKQARIKLETIKKLDSVLNGKPGSINPETGSFKTANSALLTQLGEALRQIEKAYPDTPATMEARLLGKRWFNTNAD